MSDKIISKAARLLNIPAIGALYDICTCQNSISVNKLHIHLKAISEECRTAAIMLRESWDDIQRLRAENENLQSKIDALMLEFCPDEMTPEQKQEW